MLFARNVKLKSEREREDKGEKSQDRYKEIQYYTQDTDRERERKVLKRGKGRGRERERENPGQLRTRRRPKRTVAHLGCFWEPRLGVGGKKCWRTVGVESRAVAAASHAEYARWKLREVQCCF